jgi:pyruvate,orthophosphate dikinase
MEQVAKDVGVDVREIEQRTNKLHETNPMLGHRGVRLGITYPEITEMQARAILEAAVNVKNHGGDPHLEIMIPLTTGPEEMKHQGAIVHQVAHDVFIKKGLVVEYKVGTMIELPRACLVADKIAAEAEFFSFGTNDLTQTTFGISRDDVNKFLPAYLKQGIFKQDPFAVLDQEGVGTLIRMATTKGRSARRELKVGICGEHGGEPESVKFCHRAGLDYVSCSPFRLLTARLAAAQAAIEEQKIFNPDLRSGGSK